MGHFFGTLDFAAPIEAPIRSVQSRSTPSSLVGTSEAPFVVEFAYIYCIKTLAKNEGFWYSSKPGPDV